MNRKKIDVALESMKTDFAESQKALKQSMS